MAHLQATLEEHTDYCVELIETRFAQFEEWVAVAMFLIATHLVVAIVML
jgi:hypothetical protein